MKPVFDWIAEQDTPPDLFIGFTDGEVNFVTEPSFPVIWACNTEKEFPYGEVVRVK
jgi:hypothetical protein